MTLHGLGDTEGARRWFDRVKRARRTAGSERKEQDLRRFLEEAAQTLGLDVDAEEADADG